MCGYGSFLPKNAFFESFTYAGSRNTLNDAAEIHRCVLELIRVNNPPKKRILGRKKPNYYW